MPPALPTAQLPLAKVTHNNSVEGIMHDHRPCHHPTLKTVDGPYEKVWHDGHRLPRTSSVHPQELPRTWCKAISELNEKLTAMAFCIPIPSMTCCFEKAARYNGIKKVLKQIKGIP